MKYLREYGTTVLIVIVGVLLVYRMASGGTHPLTGKMAPDFTLPQLNGESVSLASHRGKDVVVLDFWASWCPPCRDGLPVLDKLSRDYSGKGVVIYAVNIRESKGLLTEFANLNKLSLPMLLDDTGVIADDYGVQGIPQTVIIDRNGRIQKIHVGVSFWGFETELKEDIEAAGAVAPGST